MPSTALSRCPWAMQPPVMTTYHDVEWGVPIYDDRKLFALLVLDAMQAGLSWLIVLRKREAIRQAFDQFDPERIARYSRANISTLLQNPALIRNRLKIEATIANAQAFLQVVERQRNFHTYLWSFVDGQPVQPKRRSMLQIPTQTAESQRMSRALMQVGFRFVGPTICYAFMQAAGLVNDHLIDCFRHRQLLWRHNSFRRITKPPRSRINLLSRRR